MDLTPTKCSKNALTMRMIFAQALFLTLGAAIAQADPVSSTLPVAQTEVAISDWIEITQDRVNRFADATGDHQWIHLDVERARRESPYGGPRAIAAGPPSPAVTATTFSWAVPAPTLCWADWAMTR